MSVTPRHPARNSWTFTRPPPARRLDRRAALLARALGLDPDRAARWAAIYAVGASCESWRPDTGELRAWARSGSARDLLSAGASYRTWA